MTDIEAIEWLKQIRDKYIHGGDAWFDEQRCRAIEYAIECIYKRSKWIPVSERLPEKGQSGVFPDESVNVLVYREYYDEIRVGHYDYHWNEFYTVDDLIMGRVTHWMPLPEPPKEENK